MSTKVSKSFVYNAICDICGFKKKNTELFKRWDGFMVCKEDWETRNLADFYDTPNDTHLLPWTRPDSGNTLTWTPVFTGSGGSLGTATVSNANYIINNSVLTFSFTLLSPTQTTSNSILFVNGDSFNLPVTSTSGNRGYIVTDSLGRKFANTGVTFLGNLFVLNFTGSPIIIPARSAPYYLTFSGNYGV